MKDDAFLLNLGGCLLILWLIAIPASVLWWAIAPSWGSFWLCTVVLAIWFVAIVSLIPHGRHHEPRFRTGTPRPASDATAQGDRPPLNPPPPTLQAPPGPSRNGRNENGDTGDRSAPGGSVIQSITVPRIPRPDPILSIPRPPPARHTAASIALMSGPDFEKYLADVFTKAGYAVEHVGRSGDHGADLIIEKDAVRTAVQAKRQGASVGQAAVREGFFGFILHRCHRFAVVTNSTFTKGAREEAAAMPICTLIDGADLRALIDGRIKL